jgi:hypothetical protein
MGRGEDVKCAWSVSRGVETRAWAAPAIRRGNSSAYPRQRQQKRHCGILEGDRYVQCLELRYIRAVQPCTRYKGLCQLSCLREMAGERCFPAMLFDGGCKDERSECFVERRGSCAYCRTICSCSKLDSVTSFSARESTV